MGKYHCTIDLLFECFGISCMTTDNCCFHFQNRLIQNSKIGGQWYSDTSPFSIPCILLPQRLHLNITGLGGLPMHPLFVLNGLAREPLLRGKAQYS